MFKKKTILVFIGKEKCSVFHLKVARKMLVLEKRTITRQTYVILSGDVGNIFSEFQTDLNRNGWSWTIPTSHGVTWKEHMSMNKSRTLDKLLENIHCKIQAVIPDILTITFRNMRHCVQLCLEAEEGHFQHLLWQPHFLTIQVWHVIVLFPFPPVLLTKTNIFWGYLQVKHLV